MTRIRRLPRLDAVRAVLAGIVAHPSNRERRTRAVIQALLAQTKWRFTGRPSIVPFSTSRVRAVFDGGASQRAAYALLPDHAEMTAWKRHLQVGDLFVDVGANSGLYSLLACECGCEVIAVEPLADMVAQLRANLDLNGYDATIIEQVLGATEGVAHLSGPDSQRTHLSTDGLAVAMSTLDTLVGDRIIDGLKIDVEGAERLVLEGASSLLGERRIRLMQIEWNDRAEANFGESRTPVIDLLRRAGYEFSRPDAQGVLVACEPELGADLFAAPIGQVE